MSIPFLSYLEATTASIDNALHAYNKRRQESAIGSIRCTRGIYLTPQALHAPRVVKDYDRVIIPENLHPVLLDSSLVEIVGEGIGRRRVVQDLGVLWCRGEHFLHLRAEFFSKDHGGRGGKLTRGCVSKREKAGWYGVERLERTPASRALYIAGWVRQKVRDQHGSGSARVSLSDLCSAFPFQLPCRFSWGAVTRRRARARNTALFTQSALTHDASLPQFYSLPTTLVPRTHCIMVERAGDSYEVHTCTK